MMTRISAIVAVVVVTGALSEVSLASARAQAPSPACDTVRKEAILLARRINSAQLHVFAKEKSYRPLKEMLPAIPVPGAFTVQLVTFPSQYMFSIKETTPACNLAVFSDQVGVIYTAAPLQ